MTRPWPRIGTPHSQHHEARLGAIFARLAWHPLTPETEEAAMPALGIRAAIRELRLPKVSHYAIGHELAPYGLYGIRAHYRNGTAEVYLVDEGSQMLVLASDFSPSEEA